MRQLLFVLLYLSCTACSSVFLQPSKGRYSDPSAFGLKYREEVLKDGQGPNLIVWILEPKNTFRGSIFFVHGNAENISTHVQAVAWLATEGYRVILFDYRGYGGSEGEADLAGAFSDTQRALRFAKGLRTSSDPKLILFGQSLGAALALSVASLDEFRSDFKSIVVEAPFSSYRKIAREKLAALWLFYPLQWPLGFLVSDQQSPIDTIERTEGSILFLHGEADEVVDRKSVV